MVARTNYEVNMGLPARKVKTHPYIELKKGVCGGEPVIVGTRLRIGLIAEMENSGYSVDEIVGMYPHITYAQVHDALSYYYDNKDEIDGLIEENKESYCKKKTEETAWRR